MRILNASAENKAQEAALQPAKPTKKRVYFGVVLRALAITASHGSHAAATSEGTVPHNNEAAPAVVTYLPSPRLPVRCDKLRVQRRWAAAAVVAASSSSSSNSRSIAAHEHARALRERISCVLLAHDASLLAAACQSPSLAAGAEQAAVVAKGVVALLAPRSGEHGPKAVVFVEAQVAAKIGEFTRKGRDLSDLLRDNSIPTLILSNLAKREGRSYLATTLSPPLREHLPALSRCGACLSSAGNSYAAAKLEADTNVDDPPQILIARCTAAVVDAVAASLAGMPHSLRRLCRFLSREVGAAAAAVSPCTHPTGPRASSPLRLRPTATAATTAAAGVPQGHKRAASSGPVLLLLRAPLSSERSRAASASPQSSGSPCDVLRAAGIETKAGEAVATGAGLSPAEKTVGAFLFLWFIIPAVVSPDAHGVLLSAELTPAARRALVQVGKLLAALCSDGGPGVGEQVPTSSLGEESVLAPCRHTIWEFLAAATAPEELDGSEEHDNDGAVGYDDSGGSPDVDAS
ncbi:hypothetical protein HK405_004287, partial [Cladochytrium tenue]